jgi:hypothetical protein
LLRRCSFLLLSILARSDAGRTLFCEHCNFGTAPDTTCHFFLLLFFRENQMNADKICVTDALAVEHPAIGAGLNRPALP